MNIIINSISTKGYSIYNIIKYHETQPKNNYKSLTFKNTLKMIFMLVAGNLGEDEAMRKWEIVKRLWVKTMTEFMNGLRDIGEKCEQRKEP